MANGNVVEDIEKALVITKNNHPNEGYDKLLHLALASYINNILDDFDEEFSINNFLSRISRVDKSTNEPVRDTLYKYYSNDRTSIPMVLLNILYKYSIKKISEPKLYNTEKEKELFSSLWKYIGFYEEYSESKNYESLAKGLIFAGPIISSYINSLTKSNLELSGPFKKEVATDILQNRKNPNVLSNVSGGKLLNSYHASFEKGRITISSDIGYNSPNAVQQDAVLSVKKDDCYLNVVADGVSVNEDSEDASTMLVNELKNWFDELDVSEYNNISIGNIDKIITSYKQISKVLEEKFVEINDKIVKSCPNGSTTMVMALVFPSFTVISNVGDATAYVYDYDEKNIHLLSEIESASQNMGYEEARHNPNNNIIVNSIGSMIYSGINTKLVINDGTKKMLLSSDGVTDLISERHFKKLMKKKATVSRDFINAAKYKPDVENIKKKMDNISAICIEIDERKNKRKK